MIPPPRFSPTIVVILACALLTQNSSSQAPEGWFHDSLPRSVPLTPTAARGSGATQHLSIDSVPDAAPTAKGERAATAMALGGNSTAPDEITPEISSLVRGVINGSGTNPAWAKCFLFVSRQIEYEHYFGCKKGALLTLLERKGNDADKSTLLAAMLREAGYPVRYSYGVVGFLTSGQTNGWHIQDWLGVPVEKIGIFNAQRGFPVTYVDGPYRGIHHVWVEVQVGSSWYTLDSAVTKRTRISPAIDVATVTGYDRTALKSAAGGTVTATSMEGIDEAALGAYLTARTAALLAYLEQNHHGTDALALLGGWQQTSFTFADGSQPIFVGDIWDLTEPVQRFTNLPPSLLTSLTLEVRSTAAGAPLVASYTMPMAHLQGRRLSLAFTTIDSTGRAQLWLDDSVLAEESSAAVGTSVKLKVTIDHPHNNSLSATLHDQSSEKSYRRGSHYALTYAFSPRQDLLRARQEQLDAYRRAGLSDTAQELDC